MPRGRGGYRAPSNPAPVSGPGAASQRTDGPRTPPGQGNLLQPSNLVAPSQTYGERAAREGIQQSAPTTPASGEPSSPPISGGIRDALLAPTSRPDEPTTSGVPYGPGGNGFDLIPQDPDELLKAAYLTYPDPALLRLMVDYQA